MARSIMEGRMDECLAGLLDQWIDSSMTGWIAGRVMNGRIDGLIDESRVR